MTSWAPSCRHRKCQSYSFCADLSCNMLKSRYFLPHHDGLKKVQVGKDQEKAQSERNSHSKNRGGKNQIDYLVLILREHYHKPSEQLFPIRQPLSYPNLNKNMRFKQHKNLTPKHSTNGTTTEVSPWNNQQYKITGVCFKRFQPILTEDRL